MTTRQAGNRKSHRFCPYHRHSIGLERAYKAFISGRTVVTKDSKQITSLLSILAFVISLILVPMEWARAGGGDSGTSASAEGAVILMYHRFGEDQYPSTNVRLAQFEAHLEMLKKGRYIVRPVEEIVADLREGRPLASRTVGITIDDAYASVYSEAWPRLRRAGFPFTLFVATGPSDRGYKGMITWDGLRQMVAGGGVTLGNHSIRHGHMASVSPEVVRAELLEASERIRTEVGQTPRLFAYPFGEFGLATRNVAVGLGFLGALGQHSGAAGPDSDFFALPRFPINERYGDPERLQGILNTLPMTVTEVSPVDPLLTPADNPPLFGFTVGPAMGSLERLRCYLSGHGVLELQQVRPHRMEVRLPKAVPPGRTRINCTLPAGGGRWRWYGAQFYLPAP